MTHLMVAVVGFQLTKTQKKFNFVCKDLTQQNVNAIFTDKQHKLLHHVYGTDRA